MKPSLHRVDNGDGWTLDIKRYRDPRAEPNGQPPVLIIPGYCMNTFILAYHPRGTSLVEHLAGQGFEVFTANLRGQGDSERGHGSKKVGLRELALVDLPAAIRFVQAQTRAERTHLIGCSLGGSVAYAYLAHHPSAPVSSFIGMGAPLSWDHAHPLLKVVFSSTRLASLVRLKGTRRIAEVALPIAKRIPKILSLYMNTSQIDLDKADQLVRTVDDPHPHLNVQIVNWIQAGRLRVADLDVERALAQCEIPVLNVCANKDGIVPPAAARSIGRVLPNAEHLEVGDDHHWFAHADMFISDRVVPLVFEPMVRFLTKAVASDDPAPG